MPNILLYIVGALSASFVFFGLHRIDEGHVGIYWRGGALLNTVSSPGYNVQIPYLTTYEQVQVTLQTDKVSNVPCGTSGGVLINFDRIEVVNRLKPEFVLATVRKYGIHYDRIWIFDKIHHEINQFCSLHSLQEVYIAKFDQLDEKLAAALQRDCDKWETGVEIIATRVTKPIVPPHILRDYEKMELEKTKLLVAVEHAKVVEKEAEIQRNKSMIIAGTASEISKIHSEKNLVQKQAYQQIQVIADEIHELKEKSEADAFRYYKQQLAEVNRLKYTAEFLQHSKSLKLRNQTKTYFLTNMDTIQGSTQDCEL